MAKDKNPPIVKLESMAKTAEVESTYTKEEFAKAAKAVFGVPSECVIAAFSVSGVEKATEAEAKRLVKSFMSREVK